MIPNNYKGALQQPLASGFNAASTAADVIRGIDLTGKIAIVTGGNTGIGLETVKTLAQAGATVIVPARDTAKAEQNLKNIANVEIAALDLMEPASIDSFAEKFLAFETETTGTPRDDPRRETSAFSIFFFEMEGVFQAMFLTVKPSPSQLQCNGLMTAGCFSAV